MATVIYKCKNCGGPVKYSATLGKFNCEYCNTVYSEDEVKALTLLSEREDVVVDAVNGDYMEYHCPSCGANIVTDETTVATNCYYCNNPIVMSANLKVHRCLPRSYLSELIRKRLWNPLKAG